jgi:hypothetical protein
MVAKKYDRGGAIKPKYSKAKDKEQSPEERLVDAIASQGRDSESLLYLLESMRSPTSQERRAEAFDPSRRFRPLGRAFEKNGVAMYQGPSDTEGEYRGSGAFPTKQDVSAITGGRGETSSRGDIQVAKMLRDPGVMRYFMDLYSKPGKQRRANTVSLGGGSRREADCQPDRTGKIPASCKGQKDAYN